MTSHFWMAYFQDFVLVWGRGCFCWDTHDQGCRFVPYTFSETMPQMICTDPNISFRGLALVQGQIYNPDDGLLWKDCVECNLRFQPGTRGLLYPLIPISSTCNHVILTWAWPPGIWQSFLRPNSQAAKVVPLLQLSEVFVLCKGFSKAKGYP